MNEFIEQFGSLAFKFIATFLTGVTIPVVMYFTTIRNDATANRLAIEMNRTAISSIRTELRNDRNITQDKLDVIIGKLGQVEGELKRISR